MNKCLVNKCNGSGVIWGIGGGSSCECMELKKAAVVYKYSAAPDDMKTFLEELEFNPSIQSLNKVQRLAAEIKATVQGEEAQRKAFNAQMPSTYSPMIDTLKQFNNIEHFISKNYRLVFSGDTGTGKSQAAVSFAYSIAKESKKKFYYVSMHTIQNLFRFNFNDEEAVEWVEKQKELIEEADILIIDDLGKEIDKLNLKRESDLDLLKKIHDFLDGVLRMKARFVIATSNAQKEAILETYKGLDKRFLSKLIDGNAVFYEFNEKLRAKKTDDLLTMF